MEGADFWELHRRLGECYAAETCLIRRRSNASESVTDSRTLAVVPALSPPKLASPLASPLGQPSSTMRSLTPCAQKWCGAPHDCWMQKLHYSGRRGSYSKEHTELLEPPVRPARVLSPTGHVRNVWDCMGIFFLLLDVIVLPLQFVYADLYSTYPYLADFSRLEVAFWICDIILTFQTGYSEQGDLVVDRKSIARRYLKTWFLPDVIVTAVDVAIEFGLGSRFETSGVTRVLRLLRLLRVVRLGKVTRFAAFLRDRFETEVAYTQFSLALVMLSMMLIEHVIACGWFGIGSLRKSKTWIEESGNSEASFTLLYTKSLRWAFSQLGIGGTEIEPVNQDEAIYSVVVALISLVTFSTVISSMTTLVSTLQSKRMEETQQFGLLRRFLRTHCIPQELCQRITRFLQYTYHEQTSSVDEPQILGLLSKSLYADLHFERYKEFLRKMPFLREVLERPRSLQEDQTLRSVVKTAMSVNHFSEDETLFCTGDAAQACYFVSQDYVYLQATMACRPSGWIAEMCLWTAWAHVGDLICRSFNKTIAISAEAFCVTISKAGPLQKAAHKYAMLYVSQLQDADDPNDLWQHGEAREDGQVSLSTWRMVHRDPSIRVSPAAQR